MTDEALTVSELAERLGVSTHAVYRRIEKFNVPSAGVRRPPGDRRTRHVYFLGEVVSATKRQGTPGDVIPLANEGVTARDLATSLGISKGSVASRLRARKIQPIGKRGHALLFPVEALARCRLPARHGGHATGPRTWCAPTDETIARLDEVLGIVGPGKLHELIGA